MREMVQKETEKVRKNHVEDAIKAIEALKVAKTPEERKSAISRFRLIEKETKKEMAAAAEKIKSSKEYIELRRECKECSKIAVNRPQISVAEPVSLEKKK